MYKLGDREQLSKKYGNINTKPVATARSQRQIKKTAVNQNASFNQMTKITLPLEPSTLIKNMEEPTVTVVKEHNIKGSTKLDLLNFIDLTKLKENRSGFKIKSYALEDLKHLGRLLEIFKNERPKSYFL